MAITKLTTNGVYGDKYNYIGANSNNWYEAIATTQLTTAATNITFSNIPADYTHLQLRMMLRSDRGTWGVDNFTTRFNGDTGSNYSSHLVYTNLGNGTAVSGASVNDTWIQTTQNIGTTTGGNFYGVAVMDILDYKDTSKFKTIRMLTGFNANGTPAGGDDERIMLISGNWRNTNAITTIRIAPSNGTNFTANSRISLYGLRA